MTGGVIALGAARSLPEGVRDSLGSVGQLLREDPEYQDGNYGRRGGPRRALEQLRLEYVRRIHPRPQSPEQEREQVAEAHAFASEFDANAYALLCDALARCDLTNVLDRITAKVLLVASSSDALVPPSRVQDTYHQLTAEGVDARIYEMQTDGGHPALLTEAQKLRGPITEFLASIA
jgi:homoserine O-acetyltransferase